jgi:hypothetical protein
MKRQQQERKERSRWAQEASKKNIYKVIGLITIKEPFFCLFSSSIHYKLVGSRSSRSFLSFLGCPNSLGYFCFLNTVKQKSQRLGSLVNSTLERYSQCAYSLLRMKKKIVIITGSPLSSLSIYIFFSGFCCFVYSAPASNGSTGSYIKARHRVYYCHKTKKSPQTPTGHKTVGGSWLLTNFFFGFSSSRHFGYCPLVCVLCMFSCRGCPDWGVSSQSFLAPTSLTVHQMFHHHSGERKT